MKKLLRHKIFKRCFGIFATLLFVFSFALSSSAYIYHSYVASFPRHGTIPFDYCTINLDENSNYERMLFTLSSEFLYSLTESYSGTTQVWWDDSDAIEMMYSISGPDANILRNYKFTLSHNTINEINSVKFHSDDVILSSNLYASGNELTFAWDDDYVVPGTCTISGEFNIPKLDTSYEVVGQDVNFTSELDYTREHFSFELQPDIASGRVTYTLPVDDLFGLGVNYLIGSSTKYLLISDFDMTFTELSWFGDTSEFYFYTDCYADYLGVESWSDVLSLSGIIQDTTVTVRGPSYQSGFNIGDFMIGSVNALLEPQIFGFFSLGDCLSFIIILCIMFAFMKIFAGG